jgi:pSer/pThr/pTyr-binding forkhead associated (FHA) protein
MLGQLIPVGGGSPLPLNKLRVTIGRAADNDLCVDSESVSARHCELELISGEWWVRDLGSRNGTAVNDVRSRLQRLPHGSILRLANRRFRMELTGAHEQHAVEPVVPCAIEGDSKVEISVVAAPGFQIHLQPVFRSPVIPPVAVAVAPNPESAGSAAAVGGDTMPPMPVRATRQALPAAAQATLVPTAGGSPLRLVSTPISVGRRPDSDLQLCEPDVSSRHALLIFEAGYWVVEDCKSTNGVRLNGLRVARRTLMPGDRLSIASHSFHVRYSPPEAASEPVMEFTMAEWAGELADLQLPPLRDKPTSPPEAPSDGT